MLANLDSPEYDPLFDSLNDYLEAVESNVNALALKETKWNKQPRSKRLELSFKSFR